MKEKMRKVLYGLLTSTMLMGMLGGCGNSSTPSSTSNSGGVAGNSTQAELTEGQKKYPELITVDVFDNQANFQGEQAGWFGKVVLDKFNMKLNIIAPNVAGGGDTLYQTRSANGNLGDLILTFANAGRLQDLVEADLVLDMTDYIGECENLNKYMDAIKETSKLAEADGLWAVPSCISNNDPAAPGEATDPTNAPNLRWDLYKQLGYPKMETLEDLLTVMKDMQELEPTSESGKKVYAFSLFKDWDGDIMQNAGAIASLYGWEVQGFSLYNVANGEIQRNIDDDSAYIRALKFWFTANQMGIVDPESTTQNFDILSAKYTDGAVLYALWPWLGSAYYNTAEHTSQGKGFQSAVINDMKCLSHGNYTYGNNSFDIMVGSKAKDPQRMVDFIDWLYSEEGILMGCGQSGNACGPEGLTWEMKDGEPVLTEFGKKAFIEIDENLQVPEEWGTGTFKDGISALNYQTVGITDKNSEGMYYNYSKWDSVIEMTQTALTQDWKEHTGALTAIEYFDENNWLAVKPGTNYSAPDYTTDITAIKEQIKQIIIQYSWQMVFAKDESEFNTLLKEMQDTAIGLGYDQVYEVDEKNCKDIFAAIDEVKK